MKKWQHFSEADCERIILMAWGDTITFDTITREYGLTHDEVVAFMKTHQSPKTYARWRERSTKKHTRQSGKHEALTTVSSRRQKFAV
jgi:uncharacterized protein (TIGR03643 family)